MKANSSFVKGNRGQDSTYTWTVIPAHCPMCSLQTCYSAVFTQDIMSVKVEANTYLEKFCFTKAKD